MVTVREPRRGDRRDHDKDTSRRGHHKRPDKGKADRKAIRSDVDPWAGLTDDGQADLTVTGSVFNRSALDGEADVCQSLLPTGDDPGAAGTDPGPLPGSGQDGSAAPVPGLVELCAALEALPAPDSTRAGVPPPAGAAYRRPAAGPASPPGVGPGVPRSLRGTSPVPL
jgi:hypothetical protein